MDLMLLDELHGHVEFGCAALWDRFKTRRFDRLCDQASALHNGKRWIDWPQYASESNVLAFLQTLFERLLPFLPADLTAYRFIPSGTIPLRNGDCPRKTDLVSATTFGSVRNPFPTPPGVIPSWADVRVVGELKANPEKSDQDSTVVQIANYAREVFGSQPWRRWVLCFTLCGSDLRVWQFDRGGAVGSTIIDIHKQWQLFVRTFFSLATIDATSCGFDPTIQCNDVDGRVDTFDPTLAAYRSEPQRPWIWIPTFIPGTPVDIDALTVPPSVAAAFPTATTWTRLELKPSSMAKRWAIITRAAMCSRARVWGSETDDWPYVVKDQWRAPEREPEGDLISQCTCPDATGLPRSLWHGDILSIKPPSEHATADDIFSLRPPSSSRRGTTAAPNLRRVTETSHHLLRSSSIALNRIHTRLVISPAGHSLTRFTSYTQLLSALHSAVLAHRHMFRTHKILHRDISANNIILLPSPGGDDGVLIDFDLAVSTARESASGATQRTGTFDFMAYDILADPATAHTPIHDLESFFYVLLWLIIYYTPASPHRREPPPPDTIFVRLKVGDSNPYQTASLAKGNFRDPQEFRKHVLPTVASEARCLVRTLKRWHRVLFETERDWDSETEEETDDVGADDAGKDRRVAEAYVKVLRLLEDGIEALKGK